MANINVEFYIIHIKICIKIYLINEKKGLRLKMKEEVLKIKKDSLEAINNCKTIQ